MDMTVPMDMAILMEGIIQAGPDLTVEVMDTTREEVEIGTNQFAGYTQWIL